MVSDWVVFMHIAGLTLINPAPFPAVRVQDRMPLTGKPEKLMELKGTDLLGLPVKVSCRSAVQTRNLD